VAEQQNLAANKYYTVNRGDTLYTIAKNHNTTVKDLQAWNNLPDNTIFIGQSLRVRQSAHIGIAESRILQYAADCGFPQITSDKDAWCSLALNWCAMQAKLQRSGSLAARSWLKTGIPVQNLRDADIVVYWRESKDSVYGHVGIPFSYTHDGNSIWTYGGNQSDSWCVKPYPKSSLLGFVKLQEA
jgi:uncharacterized protein (TIGR02594 family)